MNTKKAHDTEVVEQLELLNKKVAEQNTIRRIFFTGIIYGIGFFIGSAIIATLAFGILSPWLGKIEWVHDNFERGASLR
jgi:hypothetical protein